MKRILFLVSNLGCGGVQKSFVSLLNAMDRSRYKIDVYLLSRGGIYSPLLPKDVNIIYDEVTEMTCDYFPKSVKRLVGKGHFMLALKRMLQFIVSRFDRGYGGYLLSRMIVPLPEEYDVAIDEGGQSLLYFMVDKVKAQTKISFFHSDYNMWHYYYHMDKKYYPRADYILTISEACVRSLQSWFPEIPKGRFRLMENISSVKFIRQMANLPIEDMGRSDKPILCTLGRLAEEKGIDIAIETARILRDKSVEFIWYFVGDGEPKLKSYYNRLVRKYALQDCIVFLGLRANPYPYVKQADIVVHPSRYEGKSIALDEVKILCKPLVVTNFSTVNDQFENRVNATICEMNPEAVAEAVIELLKDDVLRDFYIEYLKKHIRDNSEQVDVLYNLMDN